MDSSVLMEKLNRLLLFAPAFVLGLSLHEAAHAWAADKLGDPTAKNQGRLTVDPMVHLDPIGTLMFIFSAMAGFGFGWAKPVPVSGQYLRRPLRDMAFIAAAGPVSNVVQFLCWYIVLVIVNVFTRGFPESLDPLIRVLIGICVGGLLVNACLTVFNLLPIPPLDGSRIIRAFLPAEGALWLGRLEMSGLGFILLIGLMYLGVLGWILAPVFMVIISMLLPLGPDVWVVVKEIFGMR